MRLIFALLLALAPMMFERTAFAADTTLAFEPTAKESARDWKALRSQHEAYLEAKAEKNWDKARELALFHFTRAWLYNNEAFELLNSEGAWKDKAELGRVQALYEKALKECDLAEAKGRYLDEVKDCRLKSSRTLDSVKERLASL